jgi:MFS family permease
MASSSLLTNEMRSNFRHLYADVIWFGLLAGSTAAFLAVYAARQGASGFQVSLLTAGPAVVNLFFSLPAGRWLEGRSLVRASCRSSLWQRLGYLLLVPIPWLFTPIAGIWVIILITLLMAVPATLLAVSFNAMFAEIVPPHWRGPVVTRRNALLALSLSTSSLLSGQLLDHIIFPLNYQVVFALGALGALMSTYHLSRIHQAFGDGGIRTTERAPRSSFVFRLSSIVRRSSSSVHPPTSPPLLRLDLLRGPYGKFMAAYLFFYVAQNVPLPILPLYNVNVLKLTDGEISLGSALYYLMTMLTSLALGLLAFQLSHRRQLVIGGLLTGQYPLLMALARDATLYWLVSFTGGIVWAILSAGLINRLMERVPEGDRPAHMTLYNLALNLGLLVGSLAGPLIAGWFDLRTALFISFGLRTLAGLLLVRWG